MLLYTKNTFATPKIYKYYQKFCSRFDKQIPEEKELILFDVFLGIFDACCITKKNIYVFKTETQKLTKYAIENVLKLGINGIKVLLQLKNDIQIIIGTAVNNTILSRQIEACNNFIDRQKQHLSDQCSANNHTTEKSASEIIKSKLKSCGGKVKIPLLNKKICTIVALNSDTFTSDKLPGQEVKYHIFDIIVDLIKRNGGRVIKGNGRSYKVGDAQCSSNTIAGKIAYEYYQKEDGESTYDPVFVLASILEWANIAKNCRGYVELI